MEPIALLFVLFGLPSAVWPYRMARFEEQLDAIGSKRRWSEVEPADWKVMLTRYGGIVMVGGGVLWFLAG
ncbi:hypothetical protein KY092_14965 [Natronomonas gomsonensis]|jgi:hypothetical protein|uniref:hypothetical protein n=1 Tax=Natronomonas gomsonensis TaxID=1046043 RepID=UPI0020CA7936|nr:hypothetical protein [Natronomonas gomsonensis]MCY4731859.1 hypothetical protein [Natronomonas gomsonensis]